MSGSATPQDQGGQVIYLAEAAARMRDEAIAGARARLGVPERDLPLERLLGRAEFLDYVKYGLATGVAAMLAGNVPRIQAIYLYDPSGNPGREATGASPVDVTVHLLVRVGKPSAALAALITSLDRAVLASVQELPSPVFTRRTFMLDVSVISDADVAHNRGYAALLNSVFAPPLKVWERDA